MGEALGTNIQNILSSIATFLHKVEKYDDELTFFTNPVKRLSIEGTDQLAKFYSFSIFNYLAYCINTKEAYNDKYNKDN